MKKSTQQKICRESHAQCNSMTWTFSSLLNHHHQQHRTFAKKIQFFMLANCSMSRHFFGCSHINAWTNCIILEASSFSFCCFYFSSSYFLAHVHKEFVVNCTFKLYAFYDSIQLSAETLSLRVNMFLQKKVIWMSSAKKLEM